MRGNFHAVVVFDMLYDPIKQTALVRGTLTAFPAEVLRKTKQYKTQHQQTNARQQLLSSRFLYR
jgi:hypothetical protein